MLRNVSCVKLVKRTSYTRRYECFRALLLSLRKEAGLRQTELAARLGYPQSYVSKYESGQRRIDMIELEAICHALGITLREFVERFEGN
ncbi:helix-turn-helix transcriptional regulator [Desulfovibrio sp. JY]|nr:helix-turn-helix transcriptional regulator [Desulfovibrio sp. JY]